MQYDTIVTNSPFDLIQTLAAHNFRNLLLCFVFFFSFFLIINFTVEFCCAWPKPEEKHNMSVTETAVLPLDATNLQALAVLRIFINIQNRSSRIDGPICVVNLIASAPVKRVTLRYLCLVYAAVSFIGESILTYQIWRTGILYTGVLKDKKEKNKK